MTQTRQKTVGPLWEMCGSCGEERSSALYEAPRVRSLREVLTARSSPARQRDAVCLICLVQARGLADLVPAPRSTGE